MPGMPRLTFPRMFFSGLFLVGVATAHTRWSTKHLRDHVERQKLAKEEHGTTNRLLHPATPEQLEHSQKVNGRH